MAKLKIDPNPEMLIRVFVIFKKLRKKIKIKPQKVKQIDRLLREKADFVVVDWGGVLLS